MTYAFGTPNISGKVEDGTVAIRIRCPACKHPLTVPEEYYNKTVKCPICAHKFRPSVLREGGGHKVPRGLMVTPPRLQKPSASRILK
ncbi:MAG: hypothetical protein DRP63_06230, partial [Planctomycetota bacterium]